MVNDILDETVPTLPDTTEITPLAGSNRVTFRHVWQSISRSFAMFRNTKSMIGLSIIGLFVLIAIFAPLIAPFEPLAQDWSQSRQGPSATHWLGTTHMGEDIFSQLVYGTRTVLAVGFTTAIISTLLATLIGVTAGYLTGWKSEALSALTNVFLVIPALPLMIIVTAALNQPGFILVSAILAFTGWSWGARILRSQTMSLRNRDFIQAARANGEPLWRIISVEMMPNLIAIIAGSFVSSVTGAVGGLTTLSFLGIIPITTMNWGTVLFWAAQNGAFPNMWWWFVPAGVLVALLGAALSLISFGIDEYVNPRLRSAGERARALRKRGMKAGSTVTEVRAIPGISQQPDVVAEAFASATGVGR